MYDGSIHALWLSKGGSSQGIRRKSLMGMVLDMPASTPDRGGVSHVGTRNLNYSKTLSGDVVRIDVAQASRLRR